MRRRLATALSLVALASAALTGVAQAAPASNGPRLFTRHYSRPFDCVSTDPATYGTVVGSGVVRFRERWHQTESTETTTAFDVVGTVRFVADNGTIRTFAVDYESRSVDGELTLEGTFVVHDDVFEDTWYYADPGVATFSGGGYLASLEGDTSHPCNDLGYIVSS